jgi:hypothetical protein
MSDVISLADKRKRDDSKDEPLAETDKSPVDFAAIAAANEAKKKKLERERLQANKSVLRSYRITPKK